MSRHYVSFDESFVIQDTSLLMERESGPRQVAAWQGLGEQAGKPENSLSFTENGLQLSG
jgi:hypothetical protein